MLRRRFCLAAVAGLFMVSSAAQALTNSQLARQSLLKVSNGISGAEALLSADELQAMPASRLKTSTPWTDGVIEFEGVYVRDLVAKYAPKAKLGKATAFNDYQIKFELADMIAKDAFVAFKRDGEPLSRRDKGPFWVVFPWTDRPELDARAVHGLSIWQLVDLSFQ